MTKETLIIDETGHIIDSTYYNLCVLADIFHLCHSKPISQKAREHSIKTDNCGKVIKIDGKNVVWDWEPCVFKLES